MKLLKTIGSLLTLSSLLLLFGACIFQRDRNIFPYGYEDLREFFHQNYMAMHNIVEFFENISLQDEVA